MIGLPAHGTNVRADASMRRLPFSGALTVPHPYASHQDSASPPRAFFHPSDIFLKI
ncbi:hypothetical protein AGR9A_Cc210919 [Agrobacterium salinitolerans str. Hayward 0363]|nr:hypothetical protein AGR9A_Cc210919 [Agrobacterium salinitolerans str. Hayward 0363]